MNACVKITVGGEVFERGYVVCETRAPRAYDYGGTLELEANGNTRFIAVPAEQYEIQRARNASGMYATARLDNPEADYAFVDASVLIDCLLKKMEA